MVLKKHHKWIIGGSGFIVILFMMVISVVLYSLSVKQDLNYNSLSQKISDIQTSLQGQINLISEDLIVTQTNLEENQQALSTLKASIGEDFSGIYSDSVDSVVIISTNVGQGTGFVIHRNGYIVTNYHVIEGATSAGIYTSNGKGPYNVELVGTDSFMDVALLKIEGTFNTLDIGNSEETKVGEKVIAIGNPYGLQFSATSGSVSQIHRQGPNGVKAYVQIDAAVNPGNSGGPLINKEGYVIGMVNFKLGNAEGLGFALESNYIEETVNNIYEQKFNQTLI